MEQYSESTRQALEEDLHRASASFLIRLGFYFQQRGGPGYELVKAEIRRRIRPNARVIALYPAQP